MGTGTLIETRSIDYVPLAERHGKVWHLWPVWFSGDAHLATLAVGVLGITLGATCCGPRLRWWRVPAGHVLHGVPLHAGAAAGLRR